MGRVHWSMIASKDHARFVGLIFCKGVELAIQKYEVMHSRNDYTMSAFKRAWYYGVHLAK